MYIHTYIHTYIHMYIHTYIHTYYYLAAASLLLQKQWPNAISGVLPVAEQYMHTLTCCTRLIEDFHNGCTSYC
jgi:hypothetical protein